MESLEKNLRKQGYEAINYGLTEGGKPVAKHLDTVDKLLLPEK